MPIIEQLTASPFVGCYRQEQPNDPIELAAEPVTFNLGGDFCSGDASIRIRFQPTERLEFVYPVSRLSLQQVFQLMSVDKSHAKLQFLRRGKTIDTHWSSVGGENDTIVFVPSTSGMTVTTPAVDIDHAVFHLLNFPEFRSSEDYILCHTAGCTTQSIYCGRMRLEAEGWRITICADGTTSDMTEKLRQIGGFALTHIGKIERTDGTQFSSASLESILECLWYFLSFSLGRWTSAALPIGFNSAGDRVFEEWGLRRISSGGWTGGLSLFEPLQAQILSETWPGFCRLWNDANWSRSLRSAIYWYLGAADRGTGIGVDTGIILGQTALEGLAWTHCVVSRRMVSPNAFKPRGLSAADKFRLLATSLQIPTEIPVSLSRPIAPRGHRWDDGLDAITSIRNSIVHGDAAHPLPDGAEVDAWKLVLWLIEMALLRLCNYNGRYSNRLVHKWAGQTELVPWANSSPP
jgi:hypothetical protein